MIAVVGHARQTCTVKGYINFAKHPEGLGCESSLRGQVDDFQFPCGSYISNQALPRTGIVSLMTGLIQIRHQPLPNGNPDHLA